MTLSCSCLSINYHFPSPGAPVHPREPNPKRSGLNSPPPQPWACSCSCRRACRGFVGVFPFFPRAPGHSCCWIQPSWVFSTPLQLPLGSKSSQGMEPAPTLQNPLPRHDLTHFPIKKEVILLTDRDRKPLIFFFSPPNRKE